METTETTWITHLENPLVLIGFMIFIFAGFIKLLLQNNIIKFNQTNSAKLLNKSLNFVFVLALLGIILGFFSQKEILQVAIDKSENKPVEKESSSGNVISGSTLTDSTVNQAGGDITNNTAGDK